MAVKVEKADVVERVEKADAAAAALEEAARILMGSLRTSDDPLEQSRLAAALAQVHLAIRRLPGAAINVTPEQVAQIVNAIKET